MKLQYCDICQKETKTVIKDVERTFNIKHKTINVKSKQRFCVSCHQAVYDETLDHILTQKAIHTFNERYGLTGESIKALRKSFKLTQKEFSDLLGIAKKTLVSYEKEYVIPEESNRKLLFLIKEDPTILYDLSKNTDTKIHPNKLERIKKLDKTENKKTIFNGFKTLDVDFIKTLIVYFAEKGISMTKLNKALFYSDFYHYKKMGTALTGLTYVKQQFGPFNQSLYMIVEELLYSNYLEKKPVEFNGGYQHILMAKKKISLEKLSLNERQTIDLIKKRIMKHNAESISELSHEETAWQNTLFLEPISFEYAPDLKIEAF